jgi:hypothetical protein
MAADPIFTLRVPASVGADVDRFAVDAGLSRSAALLILVAAGLSQSKGAVFRSAIRSRERASR